MMDQGMWAWFWIKFEAQEHISNLPKPWEARLGHNLLKMECLKTCFFLCFGKALNTWSFPLLSWSIFFLYKYTQHQWTRPQIATSRASSKNHKKFSRTRASVKPYLQPLPSNSKHSITLLKIPGVVSSLSTSSRHPRTCSLKNTGWVTFPKS